ncbi:hypothetical protein KDW_54370 [Dictyobacter vulcani]|uniref:DUF3324 domain-containing protein n=1 Tax=Dictyobacter vulcani TaxID=2607529 RepID=A0A5J4KTP5_9CHLR|nr:DUF916 domain-containing protein [Dictyobacter vulcani]GER91275.1 hypothetical protein KDW_54370 [Dictyobacter vulcani]
MRMFSVFPGYRFFLYVVVVVLMVMMSLKMVTSVKAVKVTDHQAMFSLMPTVWDRHDPITAGLFMFKTHLANHLHASILVTNTGNGRGTVNLYPADASSAPTGGASFSSRDAELTDVGSWIKLSKEKVTLDPGKSQSVPFEITIPVNTDSGEHIGGIIAEDVKPLVAQAKKIPIHIRARWAVPIVLTLPGPTHEKLIATGILPDRGLVYQHLMIGLSNAGNIRVKANGSLQILDDHGHLIQKHALQYETLLPRTSIQNRFYIQHKALGVGHYQAVLDLYYGHNKVLKYRTEFIIKPPVKDLGGAIVALVKLGDTDDLWSLFAPWQIASGAGIGLILLGFLGYGLTKFCLKVKHQLSQHQEH